MSQETKCPAEADLATAQETSIPSSPTASPSAQKYVVIASFAFAIRFTAMAAWFPYLFLWLEDIGFTLGQRGTAGTVFHVGRFVSQFIWGPVADWSGRHLLIFYIVSIANCIALGLLPVMRHSFVAETAVLLLTGLTEWGSLGDALIIRSLHHVGKGSSISRSRSFGSLTWVLVSPLFGWMARTCGIDYLFYVCILILSFALPLMRLFPVTEAYGATKRSAADNGLGSRKERWMMLCNAHLIFCLFLVFMGGLHLGIVFSYAFIYFETQGAPGILLGLCLTLQAVIEMPMFMIADSIVRRMGISQSLFGSMILIAMRFAGYMLVPNVWLVLLPEVIHGIVFTITFTSLAYLAEEGTPYGLQASLMGLATGVRIMGQITANSGWVLVVNGVGLGGSFWVAAAIFGFIGFGFVLNGIWVLTKKKGKPNSTEFDLLEDTGGHIEMEVSRSP